MLIMGVRHSLRALATPCLVKYVIVGHRRPPRATTGERVDLGDILSAGSGIAMPFAGSPPNRSNPDTYQSFTPKVPAPLFLSRGEALAADPRVGSFGASLYDQCAVGRVLLRFS